MPYKDKEKARENKRQYRASHLEQFRQGSKRYYDNHKGKEQERGRQKYDAYIERGLCTKCGMPLNNESRMGVLCLNCYIAKCKTGY